MSDLDSFIQLAAEKRKLLWIGIDKDKQADIKKLLYDFEFELTFCDSTTQALEWLKASNPGSFEAFIIDGSCLNRDEFVTFHTYRQQPSLRTIPMIIQINTPNTEVVLKAFEKGVFFSLNYPFSSALFNTVLMAATHGFSQHLEVTHRLSNFENVRPLLQKAVFEVQTVQDAQTVSSVLAFISPDQKRVAIGLFELILNAIEHGNLGIGYEEKTLLTSNGTLQKEIERRLALPENRDKRVQVTIERTEKQLEFTIKDCGTGFDYTRYLNFVENRALDHHGRGIMIANQLSFDALEYQDSGSKVVCKVNV